MIVLIPGGLVSGCSGAKLEPNVTSGTCRAFSLSRTLDLVVYLLTAGISALRLLTRAYAVLDLAQDL